MNEFLIGFMLLCAVGIPMTIVELYRELRQERIRKHKSFLKNHPNYKINWRGDLIKRR